MEITIKTLAAELGLSIATVSRALQDSHEVADKTKKRVLEMAKKLNYHPNPYASSLRKQKSKTIAVIIPEIANNFFSFALKGIQKVVEKEAYNFLVYLTEEDIAKEIAITKQLQSGRVDGIIIALSSQTDSVRHLWDLHNMKIPIVFFDRVCDEIEASKVYTNNFESAMNATDHLIENGCKRIGYFQLSNKLSLAERRISGYRAALEKYQIGFDEELILTCGTNVEENHQRIKKLISEKAIDGIFASVETLTITSYDVCKDLGLSIPGDMKIVSFSNLATAHLLSPPLTTINQPAFDMGMEAASLLFRNLTRYNPHPLVKKSEFKSVLIARESSALTQE
jgi:LacI family transcriptional regulator